MSPAAQVRRKVTVPVLGITGLAWLAVAFRSGTPSFSSGGCCVPAPIASGFSLESLKFMLMHNQPSVLLLAWSLMLAAMMAPLLASPLRHVFDRSFARRRARAILLFLAGYFGIWMVAGIVILSLVLAVRLLIPDPVAQIALVGTIAFVWQCSPAKQVCLNRAHAHPKLAAFGREADLDALRFGFTHGDWCVGSCWALMWLSEVILTGHLFAMALVTIWVLAEHLERPTLPRWRLRGPRKAMRITFNKLRLLDTGNAA